MFMVLDSSRNIYLCMQVFGVVITIALTWAHTEEEKAWKVCGKYLKTSLTSLLFHRLRSSNESNDGIQGLGPWDLVLVQRDSQRLCVLHLWLDVRPMHDGDGIWYTYIHHIQYKTRSLFYQSRTEDGIGPNPTLILLPTVHGK